MKKIMFNDRYGLTDAVLSGRKTMTRRIIKGDFEEIKAYHANGGWHFIADTKDWDSVEVKPAYEIGEKVAIAQAYQTLRWPALPGIDWKATTHYVTHSKGWSNKMFVKAEYMPYRIRITNIKLERLQDISEQDCLKEGILIRNLQEASRNLQPFPEFTFEDWSDYTYSARAAFAALIDRISRKGTWNLNPWVFVYEFELIK